MNYGDFLAMAADADPHQPVDYSKETVRVIDVDGFTSEPVSLIWNEDDQCFYLRTKWEN